MSSINPFQQNRRWLWTSAAGLILFLIIQVFPITGQLFTSNHHSVMTRSEAKSSAIEIANTEFRLQAPQADAISVTHLTDSQTVGYLSKHSLLDTYEEQRSKSAPTDVYAVKFQLQEGAGHLILYLHMESGALVSWQHLTGETAIQPLPDKQESLLASNALSYAGKFGMNTADWEWSGTIDEDGSITFNSRKSDIGESQLWMKVVVPTQLRTIVSSLSSSPVPWQGGQVTYGVDLPSSFTDYLAAQEKLSSNLTIFGFIIPQILFFIIAIVYAGTHGKFTSYRRGIFLSLLFFVMYAAITFNLIPGLRASSWEAMAGQEDGAMNALITMSIVIYAGMALLTYFSAVAGDGLWKSMGKALWPRWQEPGYGASVLRSMREGYFLAFILLGAQSVILLVLEETIGSFSTSDASQSMYNMNITWVLPLLAWCAGISEELQNRLLGIGVFRSWFVSGARKLLRREPSQRSTAWLTAAAMLPPGLLWAMGHVGYAIYPVYTRIIELVILAMLFGWFMLRFGIMTVIFAHVTLNAILMGMQMMFDGLPGDLYGGLFSLIMPAITGMIIYWLHGRLRGRSTAVKEINPGLK